MVAVGLGQFGVLQGDGPFDAQGRVGEVDEGVRLLGLGRPVVVDEVGVRRAVLKGLVAVGHTLGDEDGRLGTHLDGDDVAEGVAVAQVDPGAQDASVGDRDELVPGLGVHAAGDPGLGVVGHVVLDRTEVGHAEGGHLLALPVLLEPAAVVTVQGQVKDEEARDVGGVDAEVAHHCPFAA